MLNKDNTAIIFGCSPFINKISQDNINYLINNYYHIGINNFISLYPNIKNILYSDYGVYDWIRPSLSGQNILLSQTAYHNNFVLDNREKSPNVRQRYIQYFSVYHDFLK